MIKFTIGSVFVYILLLLTIGYGWIMNLIALIHMHDGITGLMIARVVGLFIIPLGTILGIFV